jgi:hypothetical protein
MKTAQQVYIENYKAALAALEAIKAKIHDLPSPSEKIDWADAEDMVHAFKSLEMKILQRSFRQGNLPKNLSKDTATQDME